MNVPRSISFLTGITLFFATASFVQQVRSDFDQHASGEKRSNIFVTEEIHQ